MDICAETSPSSQLYHEYVIPFLALAFGRFFFPGGVASFFESSSLSTTASISLSDSESSSDELEHSDFRGRPRFRGWLIAPALKSRQKLHNQWILMRIHNHNYTMNMSYLFLGWLLVAFLSEVLKWSYHCCYHRWNPTLHLTLRRLMQLPVHWLYAFQFVRLFSVALCPASGEQQCYFLENAWIIPILTLD